MCTQAVIYLEGMTFSKTQTCYGYKFGILTNTQEAFLEKVNLLRLTEAVTEKLYRVIHKSLRDFRHLRYSSPGGHAEGEHVNRGRDTPYFCLNLLQALDMSTLGDVADVNLLIKSGI